MQEHRKTKQIATSSSEDLEYELIAASSTSDTQEFLDIWEHMCLLIKNPIDQLLMRCAFIYDMKPAEITVEHPNHWQSAREVSLALYSIRKILRNDSILREMIGLSVAI